MLSKILQILPVFIYKWIARKFCEEIGAFIGKKTWVMPAPDILILKKK